MSDTTGALVLLGDALSREFYEAFLCILFVLALLVGAILSGD